MFGRACILFLLFLTAQPVTAAATEIHLFTGWLHVYSKGLSTIASKAPASSARVHRHEEADAVTRDIIARHKRGELSDQIALIGHSMGGNAITRMANQLAQHKIPVVYLGVLDAVGPSPIPGNVAMVDNFMSSCGWFSGQRLSFARDFHGERFLLTLPTTCHANLDDDPAVQERILSLLTLISYGFLPG